MEIFPNLPSLIFHVVFSTRGQAPLITAEIGILLYSYLDGLIQSEGGMVIESGGMPDHIHLLASFSHEKSVEEMIQAIKSRSADWLNDKAGLEVPFGWQESYAVFSVSQVSAAEAMEHLRKQAEYHRHKSFEEEFIELLKEHGVDYDEDGLWD